MGNISDLLWDISKISSAYEEPTIFDMIGNRSRETMHSAIIGYLLNPWAHEAGMECLKEFIKLFPDGSRPNFNPDTVTEIKVEKNLGPVLNENNQPTGGRADIYLEDSEGNVIVIENKIYAGDPECQLLRYHNSLRNACKPHSIVYLTLNGKKPSKWSLGVDHVENPLTENEVNIISYSTILQWLSKIQNSCSPSMKANIEQYSRLLSNFLMENQINEKILSSGDSYRAAIEIAKNLEDARIKLKKEFMELLRKQLTVLWSEVDNYIIEEYNNQKNSKLVGISILSKSSDLRFDVVIDWRLYITCNRNYPKILKEDNGTWDYVGDRNAYNFHECSELVTEYLSSEDSKHLVSSCAAHQLVEILDGIEGRN